LNRSKGYRAGIFAVYFFLVGVSWATGVGPGRQVGLNFVDFFLTMIRILPFAFILISLFEMWVPDGFIERHMGEGSGAKGYVGAILLAGMTIGGLFVALPAAFSLNRKGASLGVVFTYVGATAVCRVPMTVFEASFMGLKFTLIRYAVSLPLVVLTSIILGRYLQKRGFALRDGEEVVG